MRIFNRADENGAGDCILTEGDEASVIRAYDALVYLKKAASLGDELSDQSVDYVIRMVQDGAQEELSQLGVELGLQIRIQRSEIFEAMHQV